MSKFDADEIGTLMHVAERVHREHPNMAHIHRHALHRLRQIDRELSEEPTDVGIPSPSTANAVPQAAVTTGEPGRATTSGTAPEPVPNPAPESATQPAPEAPASPGTPTAQPQPTAEEAPKPSLVNQPGPDTQPGGVATPPASTPAQNPEPPTPGEAAPLQRRV